MSTSLHERCRDLVNPGYLNLVLSIGILLGILLSYLPQHIRIISRKSSFGLSPYFVLLGTTSGTCQFANILALRGSREVMACCSEVDGFVCFAGLLGIMQVGMQWTCFAVILLLFLIYFPRATPVPTLTHPDAVKKHAHPTFRTAVVVGIICVVHAFLTVILSLYFSFAAPQHLLSYANGLGVTSTVLAIIQYFPQIYTTFMLKRVASLSIPMMCIQTPGSFVWAASLAARLGSGGWSAWGVYVVTGTLQGSLLVMGIWYDVLGHGIKDEEASSEGESATDVAGGEEDAEANEQTPLIRDAAR